VKNDWASLASQLRNEIEITRARLERLEAACASLEALSQSEQRAPGKRAKTVQNPVEKKTRGRPKGSRRQKRTPEVPRPKLPATGGDFWLSVLGDGQKTGLEIVNEALTRLQLDDTARDAMYSRAGNWFNTAIKKGLVVVAGEREGARVYQHA